MGHSRHIAAVFGSSAPFKWLPVVVAPADVANASLQMLMLLMLMLLMDNHDVFRKRDAVILHSSENIIFVSFQ